MSVLGNVINWILGLGAAIFVPIIIIIAGLIAVSYTHLTLPTKRIV